jgi:hypothetical protein
MEKRRRWILGRGRGGCVYFSLDGVEGTVGVGVFSSASSALVRGEWYALLDPHRIL